MKILKKVGFFRELYYGNADGESIFKFVHKGANYNIDKVSNYLKKGVVLMISPQITEDILSDERKKIGTLCIQTDGIWAWPSDLTYYTLNYNILLPSEFIEYMANNNWIIKNDIDIFSLAF
ncbi:hypothetical protein [Gilliamella sp. Pas-s25]|uniref:hypothetical protein n=1 Tax=Gilliamella sp. Pas-s25 TaxID=2687310 RepID=UPI00135DC5F5|nr:hypothetical protein [Gilliamella sp. Pas-s25]MWP62727.1 hypothetical protein [Gilliamella sp. Pas-s25]